MWTFWPLDEFALVEKLDANLLFGNVGYRAVQRFSRVAAEVTFEQVLKDHFTFINGSVLEALKDGWLILMDVLEQETSLGASQSASDTDIIVKPGIEREFVILGSRHSSARGSRANVFLDSHFVCFAFVWSGVGGDVKSQEL